MLRSWFPLAVIATVAITALPDDAAAQRLTPAQQRRLEQQRQQQARQRAGAKKPPAKKPAKSNLPTFAEVRSRVSVAKVDNTRLEDVRRSAARIDRLVSAGLREAGQSPNGDTTDSQFVRRAFLDIVGRIPTAKETSFFLRSGDTRKRERLIDRLLNSPGYASHAYNQWADVLRLVDKANNNVYLRPYSQWIKDSLRENKPYDEMVFEMLTAEGKVWDNPAAGYVLRDPGMPLDSLNNTVRVFLGTRIGCAQCHDHPFDRWTQKEFYQLAAFTGGVLDRVPGRAPKGVMAPTSVKMSYKDLPAPNSPEGRSARALFRLNRAGVWENPYRKLQYPHDYAYDDAKPKQVVQPSVLFGSMPDLPPKGSRREAFARWLTAAENPRFARVIANRMWKQAFGVGLIEPVDDMRDDTVASNEPLMQFLESEMRRLKFDLKEFQRIVLNTRSYQRQSTMTDIDPEKPYLFPGPVLRRMTAEQVWDSLVTLTVPNPDEILRADDEEYVSVVSLDSGTTRQQLLQKAKQYNALRDTERKERRKRLYKGIELARASELPQPLDGGHFLRQFGQSDRQVIADSSTDGTVPQLLTMFNGPVTHMMLEGGSVMYVEVTSQKSIDDAVDIVFLSLLNRRPTRSEKVLAKAEIEKNRGEGVGDVIWALLNTREFLFVQ